MEHRAQGADQVQGGERSGGLVKVAVLGAGSLGKEHVRIYAELAAAGDVEFLGVYDTVAETAQRFAQKYQVRAFGMHGLHSLPHGLAGKLAEVFANCFRHLLPALLFAARNSHGQCVTHGTYVTQAPSVGKPLAPRKQKLLSRLALGKLDFEFWTLDS